MWSGILQQYTCPAPNCVSYGPSTETLFQLKVCISEKYCRVIFNLFYKMYSFHVYLTFHL